MHCEQCEMLLGQLVFDELDDASKTEVMAHLSACAACSERLGDLRVTVNLLREGVAAAPAPKFSDKKRAALMKQLARPAQPRRLRLRTWWNHPAWKPAGLIAAGVALAVTMAGILMPSTASEPTGSARRAARSTSGTDRARDEVVAYIGRTLKEDVITDGRIEFDEHGYQVDRSYNSYNAPAAPPIVATFAEASGVEMPRGMGVVGQGRDRLSLSSAVTEPLALNDRETKADSLKLGVATSDVIGNGKALGDQIVRDGQPMQGNGRGVRVDQHMYARDPKSSGGSGASGGIALAENLPESNSFGVDIGKLGGGAAYDFTHPNTVLQREAKLQSGKADFDGDKASGATMKRYAQINIVEPPPADKSNTFGVAVDAARAYAGRKVADGNDGKFEFIGAAVLVTTPNELTLVDPSDSATREKARLSESLDGSRSMSGREARPVDAKGDPEDAGLRRNISKYSVEESQKSERGRYRQGVETYYKSVEGEEINGSLGQSINRPAVDALAWSDKLSDELAAQLPTRNAAPVGDDYALMARKQQIDRLSQTKDGPDRWGEAKDKSGPAPESPAPVVTSPAMPVAPPALIVTGTTAAGDVVSGGRALKEREFDLNSALEPASRTPAAFDPVRLPDQHRGYELRPPADDLPTLAKGVKPTEGFEDHFGRPGKDAPAGTPRAPGAPASSDVDGRAASDPDGWAKWRGSIGYNDNHVDFDKEKDKRAPWYGDNAGKERLDGSNSEHTIRALITQERGDRGGQGQEQPPKGERSGGIANPASGILTLNTEDDSEVVVVGADGIELHRRPRSVNPRAGIVMLEEEAGDPQSDDMIAWSGKPSVEFSVLPHATGSGSAPALNDEPGARSNLGTGFIVPSTGPDGQWGTLRPKDDVKDLSDFGLGDKKSLEGLRPQGAAGGREDGEKLAWQFEDNRRRMTLGTDKRSEQEHLFGEETRHKLEIKSTPDQLAKVEGLVRELDGKKPDSAERSHLSSLNDLYLRLPQPGEGDEKLGGKVTLFDGQKEHKPGTTGETEKAAPLVLARSLAAQEKLAEGRQAQASGMNRVALRHLDDGLALDPSNESLRKERDQLAAIVVDPFTPDRLIGNESSKIAISGQAAVAEYEELMAKAAQACEARNYNLALDATMQAKAKIDQNKSVLGAATYNELRNRANERHAQVATVAIQQDARAKATQEAIDPKEAELRRDLSKTEQREAVQRLLQRASDLRKTQDYDRALQLTNQALFLDPGNPGAVAMKDMMEDSQAATKGRDYTRIRNLRIARTQTDLVESTIPYNELITYPSDWPQLTALRLGDGDVESEINKRVSAKLADPIPANFDANKLVNVVDYYRNTTGVNYFVNWAALEEAGITQDQPITLQVNNAPAEKSLQAVLQQAAANGKQPLTYTILDGVVHISTKRDLTHTTSVRVYEVQDMVPYDAETELTGAAAQAREARSRQLIEAISSQVGTRDDWTSGDLSLRELNGNLVLKGSPEHHDAIKAVLAKARGVDQAAPVPVLAGAQPAQQEPEGELLPSANFKVMPVNPWVLAAEDHQSTFALDVDTASYNLARRYITKGYLPPVGSVRMEEFVNAMDYNYPCHTDGVFAVLAEAGPAPFADSPRTRLIKVAVRGKVIGRDGRKPANVVLVVDASGSMAKNDRLPLVQQSLTLLVKNLKPSDTVALVAFGNEAHTLLDPTPASQQDRIIKAINSLQPSGPTNLLKGLQAGYQVAAQAHKSGASNKLILCSDGIATLGESEADALLQYVDGYRRQGVTCTTVGFGAGAYNDEVMEKLANKGDGTYYFVDSPREAQKVFADDLTATLATIAKDAKIQVEFNKERVRRYRLIGYENRAIADKDFRNDTIDAGEVGSGQSSTALYEVELADGDSKADLGAVFVRYRNSDTNEIEEITQRLTSDLASDRSPRDARFYLAACAAEFAELMRESEHARAGDLSRVQNVLEKVVPQLPLDEKAAELLDLVRRAQGLPRAP